MGEFLLWSLIISLVGTVLINLFPDLLPKTLGRSGQDYVDSRIDGLDSEPESGTSILFPWKAMLVASISLTVIVNLIIAFTR
ncbi:MAG: hypothetical protein WBG08_01510 [Litorimonas sp.]